MSCGVFSLIGVTMRTLVLDKEKAVVENMPDHLVELEMNTISLGVGGDHRVFQLPQEAGIIPGRNTKKRDVSPGLLRSIRKKFFNEFEFIFHSGNPNSVSHSMKRFRLLSP